MSLAPRIHPKEEGMAIGIKKGAVVKDLSSQMLIAIGYLWGIFLRLFNVQLVITSGTDSIHSINSLHYVGKAIDIRIRDFSPKNLQAAYNIVKEDLDAVGFDTVMEKDHIHIEWDPKEGETLTERIS